ncbi:MAG: hypothetical protein ACPLIG_04425 [Candidatus Bathyarchaeales archaeon]
MKNPPKTLNLQEPTADNEEADNRDSGNTQRTPSNPNTLLATVPTTKTAYSTSSSSAIAS